MATAGGLLWTRYVPPGPSQVVCDAIKRDADKVDFTQAELRRAGRRAEPAAVHALVEACGADLRELASACQQLIADTTGVISVGRGRSLLRRSR